MSSCSSFIYETFAIKWRFLELDVNEMVQLSKLLKILHSVNHSALIFKCTLSFIEIRYFTPLLGVIIIKLTTLFRLKGAKHIKSNYTRLQGKPYQH